MDSEYCKQWSWYFDGGGEPCWRGEFKEHLVGCSNCRQQLSEAAAWDVALREYAAKSPTEFRWSPPSGSRPAVANQPSVSKPRRTLTVAAALAASVVCGAVLWRLAQPEQALSVAKAGPQTTTVPDEPLSPTSSAPDGSNEIVVQDNLPPAIIRKLEVPNHLIATEQLSDEFTFVMLYPTITTADPNKHSPTVKDEVRQ